MKIRIISTSTVDEKIHTITVYTNNPLSEETGLQIDKQKEQNYKGRTGIVLYFIKMMFFHQLFHSSGVATAGELA